MREVKLHELLQTKTPSDTDIYARLPISCCRRRRRRRALENKQYHAATSGAGSADAQPRHYYMMLQRQWQPSSR